MKETIYRYLDIIAVAVLMAGCNDGTDMPVVDEPVDEVVVFSGEMQKQETVISRADADDDAAEWLDMSFDAWKWSNGDGSKKVPVDFVIHQDAVVNGKAQTASAVYQLKPGETNRLQCVDMDTQLKWESNNATHIFRAWTKPVGVSMAEDAPLESGTVDMSKHNLDYEYFVGTKTEELSYATHGLTVALKFEHLIGKLIIDKVTLIYSDRVETDVWGRVGAIYFPNMPTAGVFNTGVGGDDMGVTLNDSGDKGILFSLAGNADYSEHLEKKSIPFYVMPMLFADDNNYGEFYVNFYHPKGEFRRYKGNLSALVSEDDQKPLSGIKAGECLTIRLVLRDESVDGFYAYVANWSDEDIPSIKVPPYTGISTGHDLVENLLKQGELPYFILTPGEDVIYETDADGRKVVRISDNIDLSSYGIKEFTIVVPDGYVLEGLGHNISGIPGLKFEVQGSGEIRNLYVNDKLCQKGQ